MSEEKPVPVTDPNDPGSIQYTNEGVPSVEAWDSSVLVQRYGTGIAGKAAIEMNMQQCAEALVDSNHMKPWLVLQVATALRNGAVFGSRGRPVNDAPGELRATYRVFPKG